MKLKDWALKQPVTLQRHAKYFNSFHCPDVGTLIDRPEAYRLSDYVVSSVTGGFIWFSPRNCIVNIEPLED